MKCAAISLGVEDGLKEQESKEKIYFYPEVVNKAKNKTHSNYFKDKTLPTIDNDTRWSSCYLMIESLSKCTVTITEIVENSCFIK